MKKFHATILVVDDDENDQTFVVRAFRKIGVTEPIHAVSGGDEAIAYMKGAGKYADRTRFAYPTFIMTDLKMPKGDGFAVLYFLKSNPDWAVIPTVVFSASADLDDIKKSYLLGASSYHIKPHNPEKLHEQIAVLHAYWLTCEVPLVDRTGKQMDALIQEVLTYTRLPRGEIKIEIVNLDSLIHQIIDTYPQLQASGVEIKIEGVLPKVIGAETSLAQSISNLLTNAVKFVAPRTAPRVRIHAEIIGPDVRLWLEDNGIGINAKDHDRIFKMFERLDTASGYEGTGMGLAIVRKAVERMGGKLGVESEIGRGSRFWIQLKGAGV